MDKEDAKKKACVCVHVGNTAASLSLGKIVGICTHRAKPEALRIESHTLV